ncbi:MAG: hypothetical protein M3Q93_02520 [Gemmatimonadota bacterium]|nr:hypothetical protein [Gemmatimonadales bacterium]MDQ3136443.1 hypothetical protein [Gemmatimonadota bacterium]
MTIRQAALGAAAMALVGCSDDNNAPQNTSFTVTIQDASTPGLLATARAGGSIPLSPGAYAVFTGSNPLFGGGSAADEGTELIAEDGFAEMKDVMLAGASNVSQHGVFESPGGPDAGPASRPPHRSFG